MDFGFLLNYGLPGLAMVGVIAEGIWIKKAENEIDRLKTATAVTAIELKKLNEKMDVIVTHLLQKGLNSDK